MALNQYETDEQRAEVLIDWLKRNVGFILLLIVVVVGAIVGVEYYKNHSSSKLNQLYDAYEASLTEISQSPLDTTQGAKVIAENEGVYKVFSAMILAKEAHGAKEYGVAESYLKQALSDADEEGLKSLLQYRLAIVQYDQNKNEDALASLQEIQAPEFLGLRKVLEGDIYLSLGKEQDAKISYEEALKSEVVPENALSKFNRLNAQ